jgi:hypothetical protein
MQVIRDVIMLQQNNFKYVLLFVIKISKQDEYLIFKQAFTNPYT